MIVFPHAKINLGLNVLEKRQDGFHNIESIFYPINLCDILEIIESGQNSRHNIEMSISGMETDCPMEDNLVYKAAWKIAEHFSTPPIKIHLHKIIPSGAGLGGGSSDASFTIKLLNNLFDLKMKKEQIRKIAGELGSDCNYFIDGGVQLVTGTGDILEECSINLRGYYLVLIKPDLHVNTGYAYSKIIPSIPTKNLLQIIETGIENWNANLKNDFEKVVFSEYKNLYKIKSELIEKGAVYASMTGSGSAVYGIFENEPTDFNKKGIFVYTTML